MQIQLDSQQNNSKENENETYIKAALSVYKVQQSLYVLDFQRMEVRHAVVLIDPLIRCVNRVMLLDFSNFVLT